MFGGGRAQWAWRGGFAVLAGLCLVAASPARAQQGDLEYAVKANFLYKFVPFVEWPADRFVSETEAINICVVGPDPFGSILEDAVAGQSVGAHAIVVHRLDAMTVNAGCHVLFAVGPQTLEALNRVRGSAVLTVTDAELSGNDRGIIHFLIADNRVRFVIDTGMAAENRLTVSSRLLALALSVREGD